MPSAKHNSTMERATGLISSLRDITLSRDIPFRQPQQLHSEHHHATFMQDVAWNGFQLAFYYLKQHGFIAEKFFYSVFYSSVMSGT